MKGFSACVYEDKCTKEAAFEKKRSLKAFLKLFWETY